MSGEDKAASMVRLQDLETTPEVRQALESTRRQMGLRRLPAWVEEELKLQFYYGGQDVACKQTPRGRVVVAAGTSEEVARALERFSPSEREGITLVFPDPWDVADVYPTTLADEA